MVPLASDVEPVGVEAFDVLLELLDALVLVELVPVGLVPGALVPVEPALAVPVEPEVGAGLEPAGGVALPVRIQQVLSMPTAGSPNVLLSQLVLVVNVLLTLLDVVDAPYTTVAGPFNVQTLFSAAHLV
jgi:hypothetical protein